MMGGTGTRAMTGSSPVLGACSAAMLAGAASLLFAPVMAAGPLDTWRMLLGMLFLPQLAAELTGGGGEEEVEGAFFFLLIFPAGKCTGMGANCKGG